MSSTSEGSNKRRGPYRGVSGKGFALITAILAVMILMALGILALNVSTGDLRISARLVGEKKALAALETGINRVTVGFDPLDLDHILDGGVKMPIKSALGNPVEWQSDAATDPASRYTIDSLSATTFNSRDLMGFSDWEQKPYIAQVTGIYTSHDSKVQVDMGIGYAVPKPHGYE
jgi:hypothetical protein